MHRIPFDLPSIRLARQLKSPRHESAPRENQELRPQQRARVEALYANVPDAVLARMERLLLEREQLKQMISTLLHRVA